MANCKNIVLTDLGRRPWLTPPVRPRPGAEEPTETVVFRRAELASAQFLSVREAQCQWAAALTIEDQFADRYFAFHHLTEHAGIGWQAAGSFIGPDHVLPGKPDPSLSLDALCAEGVFFAGGRLQDTRELSPASSSPGTTARRSPTRSRAASLCSWATAIPSTPRLSAFTTQPDPVSLTIAR